LVVLEYLSDMVCLCYGQPGHSGVFGLPGECKFMINTFLRGAFSNRGHEWNRFRETPLSFEPPARRGGEGRVVQYPGMIKVFETFSLEVRRGSFSSGEIVVLLGQNGSGKTTFIKMLAGLLKPDGVELQSLRVSIKPQEINVKFCGTVRELIIRKIETAFSDEDFVYEVLKPMLVETLYNKRIRDLSGGELQRLALVLSLGLPADVYLIDEPSAYLDVEQRISAGHVIRNFIVRTQKTAFVVEHDFRLATYLADKIIVYEGEPGVKCVASAPLPLNEGMNSFLKQLDVSIRRDGTTRRPCINKPGSAKDVAQKKVGQFYVDE